MPYELTGTEKESAAENTTDASQKFTDEKEYAVKKTADKYLLFISKWHVGPFEGKLIIYLKYNF